MNNLRIISGRTALLATASVVVLLAAAGCESDAVAPQDPAPTATLADAATQAGLVARAATVVAPQIVTFAGKSAADRSAADKSPADVYSHTFTAPPISGTVYLAFFAADAPSSWQTADAASLYTAPGEALVISIDTGGAVALSFDIAAAIDRQADTAVVDGDGTFASGVFTGAFSFASLAVSAASPYPTGGSMTFTGGGHTLVVTFDGSATAVMAVDGTARYTCNLATGAVSPI